ncbi:MAG: hypothetical protein WCW62_11560 [Bacteroidales bacterium]
MKAKFADLVTYMESLATHHKGILNRDDEKHFFRFELEEMLTGMKSNMNYPALVMEGYDFNFVDENSDNLQKRVSCAFMLLGKVSDKGDYDAIHTLWDSLEEIGDEIVVRILSDKRDRKTDCLAYFHARSITGTPITDMNLIHYGFRYAFELSWPVNNDINPEVWNGSDDNR